MCTCHAYTFVANVNTRLQRRFPFLVCLIYDNVSAVSGTETSRSKEGEAVLREVDPTVKRYNLEIKKFWSARTIFE